jgi:putative FmdB family regulatory protein
MPTYEYQCPPCRIVYEVHQRASDAALTTCPRCQGAVTRLMSAPNVNRRNFSSPTAARYARMSHREEGVRESELQKTYRRVWLPPPVKHNPWDD